MNSFVLTPRAEQDVSHIWGYMADDSVEAVEGAIVKLSSNPGLGPWREESSD